MIFDGIFWCEKLSWLFFAVDSIYVFNAPSRKSEVFVGEKGVRFGRYFSLFGFGGFPEEGKVQKGATFHILIIKLMNIIGGINEV